MTWWSTGARAVLWCGAGAGVLVWAVAVVWPGRMDPKRVPLQPRSSHVRAPSWAQGGTVKYSSHSSSPTASAATSCEYHCCCTSASTPCLLWTFLEQSVIRQHNLQDDFFKNMFNNLFICSHLLSSKLSALCVFVCWIFSEQWETPINPINVIIRTVSFESSPPISYAIGDRATRNIKILNAFFH